MEFSLALLSPRVCPGYQCDRTKALQKVAYRLLIAKMIPATAVHTTHILARFVLYNDACYGC
jgi:hypothetical protein